MYNTRIRYPNRIFGLTAATTPPYVHIITITCPLQILEYNGEFYAVLAQTKGVSSWDSVRKRWKIDVKGHAHGRAHHDWYDRISQVSPGKNLARYARYMTGFSLVGSTVSGPAQNKPTSAAAKHFIYNVLEWTNWCQDHTALLTSMIIRCQIDISQLVNSFIRRINDNGSVKPWVAWFF